MTTIRVEAYTTSSPTPVVREITVQAGLTDFRPNASVETNRKAYAQVRAALAEQLGADPVSVGWVYESMHMRDAQGNRRRM